nr:MAG TPA: hypothetical protein [Caudoviricetes sp.]
MCNATANGRTLPCRLLLKQGILTACRETP